MDALEGVVQSFTPEEKAEAELLENKIRTITKDIKAEEISLQSNFVRLSQCIDEVRSKKYWLLGKYKTFGDYLLDCEKKYGIKHSQLYVGMKVARNLLSSVSEKDLVEIGITKAGMLSKYVEQSGQTTIPEDVLQTAKTKTSTELDAAVNSKLHNQLPDSKGTWFSLEGFYADDSERQEIIDAVQLAKGIDPVIPNNIPEWQQRKEAYLRMAREFIGSWS